RYNHGVKTCRWRCFQSQQDEPSKAEEAGDSDGQSPAHVLPASSADELPAVFQRRRILPIPHQHHLIGCLFQSPSRRKVPPSPEYV
ncbi:hypothetical protein E4U35_006586, partial [Claviceps purpurea]